MGFGLVFAGYITLLFFKIMPPAMAVGAYLMYKGLKKLEPYGKNFLYSANAAAALLGYYVLYIGVWIMRFAGIGKGIVSSKLFGFCDDVIYYGILLVFHIFLCCALLGISRECGYDKGIKRAYMSRMLMAMFYVFTVINIILSAFDVVSYIPFASFICEMAWILYTSLYIYGCYMRIATDEIIEKEERKIAEYDRKYGNGLKISRKKK